MSELLQSAVSKLETQLPLLERLRVSDTFVNDLYEAAYYWCELGRWALRKNTSVDYPERARGERELLTTLDMILGARTDEAQLRYRSLLNAGREILQLVEEVKPTKDGHLGFLRIVHQYFEFLRTDFGFSATRHQPTCLRFSSGAVYVELACSVDPWMSCLFGQESVEEHFWIHDLLFLHGDQRYRTIPGKLAMNTETEVERWFQFVASVFRQYGDAALSDQPGIFDRLSRAQAKRDSELVETMNEVRRGA